VSHDPVLYGNSPVITDIILRFCKVEALFDMKLVRNKLVNLQKVDRVLTQCISQLAAQLRNPGIVLARSFVGAP
jgi:hypothetical protein